MIARLLALGVLAVLLSACANLTTIARRSFLPGDDGWGRAIHLDVQQRVVLTKAALGGIACAEPSPDALASVAAATGLGFSVPQYGSGSLANALAGSAGSIGLRTQSITLMRDAFYRICEAYYNRALNQVMVMQLLGRSQDLALGVLAIEQLTQPIAASQVLLTGSGASSSSADVLGNQQMLDAARAREEQARQTATAAQAKRDDAAQVVTEKSNALAAAQKKDPNDPSIPGLTSELEKANGGLTEAQKSVDAANASLKEATETRQVIANNANAAKTSANANAATGGGFGPTLPSRPALSDATMAKVADTIQAIVAGIVTRDHGQDACLSLLSAEASRQKIEAQQVLVEQELVRAGKTQELQSMRSQRESKRTPEAAESVNEGLAYCKTYLDSKLKAKAEGLPWMK